MYNVYYYVIYVSVCERVYVCVVCLSVQVGLFPVTHLTSRQSAYFSQIPFWV